jgi:hypothetical protein
VDELVLRDERLEAIGLVCRGAGVVDRVGLDTAQDLIADRYQALGDSVVFKPERPILSDLVAKIGEVAEPIAAIEAGWDGDTVGWFIWLSAVLLGPGPDHADYRDLRLGWYRRRDGDLRLFQGTVPPWPEARDAIEDGTILAERFDVPFYFASPDTPDLDRPRWWDEVTS